MTQPVVGDGVRLLSLSEDFVADMDREVIDFLRSRVAAVTDVVASDAHGHVELVFLRSRDPYISHTVWIDPSWVEALKP